MNKVDKAFIKAIEYNADMSISEEEKNEIQYINMKKALNDGADVNIRVSGSWTALMIFAYIGDFKCVELLLNNNADITLVDNNNWTVLDKIEYLGNQNDYWRDAMRKLLMRKRLEDINNKYNRILLSDNLYVENIGKDDILVFNTNDQSSKSYPYHDFLIIFEHIFKEQK
jgi:ankyrin repeat protein